MTAFDDDDDDSAEAFEITSDEDVCVLFHDMCRYYTSVNLLNIL